MADDRAKQSSWLQGYRAFWVYTFARFALFGVLWLILWVVGVPWLFAAAIAIVVSVPLSWFLLAKPREAFARTIESRVSDRRVHQADLGKRLEGTTGSDDDAVGDVLPPGVTEAPARNRSKRR